MLRSKRAQYVTSAVIAYVSSMALFMNYIYRAEGAPASAAADAVYQLLSAMHWGWKEDYRSMLLFAGFWGFFLFYSRCQSRLAGCRRVPFAGVLSGAVTLCHMAGLSFYCGYELFQLRQVLKLAVSAAGIWCLVYVLLHLLYSRVGRDIACVPGIPQGWKRRFWAHPMGVTCAVLLLAWLPHVLIRYPAAVMSDSASQIRQALGLQTLSGHHPVFHTAVIGAFLGLGQWLGDVNVGAFAYALVQTVSCALVLGYCVSVLVRLGAHKWTVVGSVLFFACNPYVFNYVAVVIKDTYFVAASVLFTVLLAEYALSREVFWANWKRPGALAAAAVVMTLFRNNGIYVVLATALVLLAVELVQRKPLWKKQAVLLVLVIALPLAASKTVEAVAQPEKGSIAEALSLPFQQTARFARDCAHLVTEEERQIIDKILPYDDLAALYDPSVSDPVKAHFREDAKGADLAAYFGVWLKQFLKDPMCYVGAALEQNMFLGYFGYNNHSVYVACDAPLPDGTSLLHAPGWLRTAQQWYETLMQAYYEGPVTGFFNNMALYMILMWALVLFALARRDHRQLLYLLPVVLAFGVILLAPCIRWQDRYSFPVLWAVPVLFGLYTSQLPRENENG